MPLMTDTDKKKGQDISAAFQARVQELFRLARLSVAITTFDDDLDMVNPGLTITKLQTKLATAIRDMADAVEAV